MKPSSPPELSIGLLASRVAHSIRQLVATHAEPLGISTQQFWALVSVAEETVPSQAELASRLRVDEATACRTVRALGDAGLIRCARDPEDRRRVRLELAPPGEALARRLVPVARQIRGAIDAALSAAERTTTRAALARVVARLDALAEEGPEGSATRAAPARRRAAAAVPARARPRQRPVTTARNRGQP